MNDTPRCDSLKNTDAGAWINLARQLERELGEAKAKLEKFESLERPLDRVMQHPFDHQDFGKGASEP